MTGTTNITGIATVAVPVTDQDRALEFYVGTLGFETRRDLPFGEARWIAGAAPRPAPGRARGLGFSVGPLGCETRRDLPFGEARWIEVAPPGSATTIALVPAGIPTGIRLLTADADRDHAALRSGG